MYSHSNHQNQQRKTRAEKGATITLKGQMFIQTIVTDKEKVSSDTENIDTNATIDAIDTT
jgi:hypothetical protein